MIYKEEYEFARDFLMSLMLKEVRSIPFMNGETSKRVILYTRDHCEKIYPEEMEKIGHLFVPNAGVSGDFNRFYESVLTANRDYTLAKFKSFPQGRLFFDKIKESQKGYFERTVGDFPKKFIHWYCHFGITEGVSFHE